MFIECISWFMGSFMNVHFLYIIDKVHPMSPTLSLVDKPSMHEILFHSLPFILHPWQTIRFSFFMFNFFGWWAYESFLNMCNHKYTFVFPLWRWQNIMEILIGGLDVVERCSMWPSSSMTSFETKTLLLPWEKKTPISFEKV